METFVRHTLLCTLEFIFMITSDTKPRSRVSSLLMCGFPLSRSGFAKQDCEYQCNILLNLSFYFHL